MASKGYYAMKPKKAEVVVVEASTGKTQTVVLAPNYDCWTLTHVTATELWCVEEKDPGPSGTALVRVQLDPW
jgi:hypothetical protein